MKRTSRIMYLAIITIIVVMMIGRVYAESDCNVNLKEEKNKLKINDEFSVEVNICDIKSEMGITAFGATLEYDKVSLEVKKIEGLNDWETPTNGLTFNEENGKIAITKSGFAKENEAIFKVTFKVKQESKKNLSIVLSDITASDGMELINIGERYIDITVKNGKANEKIKHNDMDSNKSGINIWIILVVIVVIILGGLFLVKKRATKRKPKNRILR